jgi:hypothetical protein
MPHQHHLSTTSVTSVTSVTSEFDDHPLVPTEPLVIPRHNSAPLMLSSAKGIDNPSNGAKRVSAPGAVNGFTFLGTPLGYHERDLESEAAIRARARGIPFGEDLHLDLQKRRDRDMWWKKNIRKFRFVVRTLQLCCRYFCPFLSQFFQFGS